MSHRLTLLVSLAGPLLAGLVAGCGGRAGTPPAGSAAVREAHYPMRQDYLVVKAPTSSVSGWYEPGLPPLASLELPEAALNGDQKALRTQFKNDGILDARKLNAEDRPGIEAALEKLFGTPQAPRIPDGTPALKEAIAGLQLDPATLAHGAKVYQNYCLNCHGLTGNGDGPAARQLIPLPRDYRPGLFKFVSSYIPSAEDQARRAPGTAPVARFIARPLRDDLRRTITLGLTGAPMPAFELSPRDLEAVISHMIFLSIRGETEFQVIKVAITTDSPVEQPEADLTKIAEQVATRWLVSQQWPMEIDADPVQQGDPREEGERKLLSAAAGYEVFNSASGGCTKCHTGYGKAAPYTYDEWGSVVRPRNLLVPVLRTGYRPEAIYARIRGGIAGSNMPDHASLLPNPADPTSLGQHKLWDVVHFVEVLGSPRLLKQLKDPAVMKPLFAKYGRKEIPVVGIE